MLGASQMAQWLKICLPMQEMWVPSLGREDPLEEEMATHSSILAWEIPQGHGWVHGVAKSQTRLSDQAHTHTHTHSLTHTHTHIRC